MQLALKLKKLVNLEEIQLHNVGKSCDVQVAYKVGYSKNVSGEARNIGLDDGRENDNIEYEKEEELPQFSNGGEAIMLEQKGQKCVQYVVGFLATDLFVDSNVVESRFDKKENKDEWQKELMDPIMEL